MFDLDRLLGTFAAEGTSETVLSVTFSAAFAKTLGTMFVRSFVNAFANSFASTFSVTATEFSKTSSEIVSAEIVAGFAVDAGSGSACLMSIEMPKNSANSWILEKSPLDIDKSRPYKI